MARPHFLSNETRAKVAIAGLACVMAAIVAHGVLYGWLLASIGEIEDTTTAESIERGIGITMLATALFASISFLCWFRRAYGNAQALGLRNAHALGWAVGGWFVPLLNLFRPVQIASEMWSHAGPDHLPRGPIIALWWTFFLLSGVFDRVGTSLLAMAVSPERLTTALQVAVAGDGLSIVAGVLAVKIVRRLTAAHEAMRVENQAAVFA